MVEMMVSIPVMVVAVAKGHGGEKGKRENSLQKKRKTEGVACFLSTLDSIFSSMRA